MEKEKIEQRITEIEKEIQSLPYHKGTEHHIGRLKAKLAKLKLEATKTKSRSKGPGFAIRKEGDGTVVLVGFPSVGKSTLLNKLTKAQSKIGHYPFTTLKVIPGMLEYKGARIQILDVPGLVKGAAMGKGRGKEVLSIGRAADLLILMAAIDNLEAFKIMEEELYLAGVRINQKPPPVLLEKRQKGGLEIAGRSKSLSSLTVKSLAQELGVLNAKITLKEDLDINQLIDVFLGNRVYLPMVRVISKFDLRPRGGTRGLSGLAGDCLLISSQENIGLEGLKEVIFQKLELIRIYLYKDLRQAPDPEPLICKKGTSVLAAAQKISQELAQEIKGAKVQGPSTSYPNQLVGLSHLLLDQDRVFFVKK